ncbi:MAG: YkvA family protein [Ectobacillus sp.]
MDQKQTVHIEKKLSIIQKVKRWAKRLKKQLFVLYVAYQDERVPWHAKLLTILIVAYAFSPVDLIPDFIPVLGYLDDLILVPLGVSFALKLIPSEVLHDSKRKMEENPLKSKPKNWLAGTIIICIWIFVLIAAGRLFVYKWI